MAELDIPDNSELLELIKSEDGEWFLGGEEFLWNTAIERGLPKLERMLNKKGEFYVHQLKYG